LWCLLFGALALVCAPTTPAFADDAPTLSAKDKRHARKLVKRANADKRAGDRFGKRKGGRNLERARDRYRKAALGYREAYALLRAPALLVDLGQVYQARGEREWALRTFRKYLELDPEGERVDDAQSAIAALETELAEARFAGEEAQPESDPALNPTDLIGPPPAPEAEPETETEAAPKNGSDGGDSNGADAATQPPTSVSDSPARPPGQILRWSGIGAAAAGVVLLGTGIGFGIGARSAAATLSGNADGWTAEDEALVATGESRQTKMYIFTGIGTAVIAGGAVLYYLGMNADKHAERRSAGDTAVVPGVTPERATLTVIGWF
jgi:tetratricopeptide (TPR) repeat protein